MRVEQKRVCNLRLDLAPIYIFLPNISFLNSFYSFKAQRNITIYLNGHKRVMVVQKATSLGKRILDFKYLEGLSCFIFHICATFMTSVQIIFLVSINLVKLFCDITLGIHGIYSRLSCRGVG